MSWHGRLHQSFAGLKRIQKTSKDVFKDVFRTVSQEASKHICDFEWLTDDVLRLDVAEHCRGLKILTFKESQRLKLSLNYHRILLKILNSMEFPWNFLYFQLFSIEFYGNSYRKILQGANDVSYFPFDELVEALVLALSSSSEC